MKTLGVIVEYNPFHNGHLFHLQQSKKQTDADIVIAVMSGQFLQRGEPALVSKWTRTKMALLNGIDIVIELPYAFATQKAEMFANGAISILSSLKCDFVCFGSEQGNIQDFEITYELLKSEKETYDRLVQKFVKEGNSFPKASNLAFLQFTNEKVPLDLTKPNNILGFHYVKAIKEQNSKVVPSTIERTVAGYHDEHFHSSPIASATSIRKHLFETNTIEEIKNYVPIKTYEQLLEYKKHHSTYHRWEDYFSLLKYKVLSSSISELADIYEVEEGLENRIQEIIKNSTTYHEFMTKLKTKRYTWTRLQRMCTHILTNTKKQEMKMVSKDNRSNYIRLLGMSKAGQDYLNSIKKELTVPLVTKIGRNADHMLELDKRATVAYSMSLIEPVRSNFINKEFSQPPIRFDEESQTFL
ncbi:nucleotidyltransferase [Bacillus sp. FJAT-45066]|uniref:nucleotidyltransferase n=1 Tax=Bacillus sp. FJAT-45066 TaxID=2011010 RepID=UPI000BB8BA8A|nr:nucleotidyltransferase [Bacillus sp. FJAT-45066]